MTRAWHYGVSGIRATRSMSSMISPLPSWQANS
jgi:hypothetical protein